MDFLCCLCADNIGCGPGSGSGDMKLWLMAPLFERESIVSNVSKLVVALVLCASPGLATWIDPDPDPVVIGSPAVLVYTYACEPASTTCSFISAFTNKN